MIWRWAKKLFYKQSSLLLEQVNLTSRVPEKRKSSDDAWVSVHPQKVIFQHSRLLLERSSLPLEFQGYNKPLVTQELE
jgi:hypothetical protein